MQQFQASEAIHGFIATAELYFVWQKGNHTHQASLARYMGPTCIFKYSSRGGLNFYNDDFFTLFCDLYVVQLKESYLAHFLLAFNCNYVKG